MSHGRRIARRGLPVLVGLVVLGSPAVAAADIAYVPNADDGTVSRVDTATNATVGSPIPVGTEPRGVVFSPDGARAYVANGDDDTVSVIDVATSAVTATVATGDEPRGIAVTPDGARVYVVNVEAASVTVIDTATNTALAGSPVAVGDDPRGVAIGSDGARAYVTNSGEDSVSVIDTATNTVVDTVTVGFKPRGVAARPDGARVYVANSDTDDVSIIDTATNATVGAPVAVGDEPRGIAFTPDGARAYVTNGLANSVSVIDTATETVVGAPIGVGVRPDGIATTNDGSRAYLANTDDDTVSAIETTGNSVIATITVGGNPRSIAIVPVEQPPPMMPPSPSPSPSPPAPAPSQPSPPAPTQPSPSPQSPQASAQCLKQTSKLQVERLTVARSARAIDILAPITGLASGNARLSLNAAGRRFAFRAPVDAANARIRRRQTIPRAQAELGTGILTIDYPGDADTRRQSIRLRAAANPARLQASRPAIVNGRLQASGTVTRLARGRVVRVQLEFDDAACRTTTLEFLVPVVDGRWSLDRALEPERLLAIANRRGTVHSYIQFTGYFPRRVRGEMQAFEVLGAR